MKIHDIVDSPGLVDPVDYFIKHNLSHPYPEDYENIHKGKGSITFYNPGDMGFIRLKGLTKVPLTVKLDCHHVTQISFDESCKFTTLRNIEKFITNLPAKRTVISLSRVFKGPALSLLLVHNLGEVVFNADMRDRSGALTKADKQQVEVVLIINKHLKNGQDGIIDCQHELIDAGFNEFASL